MVQLTLRPYLFFYASHHVWNFRTSSNQWYIKDISLLRLTRMIPEEFHNQPHSFSSGVRRPKWLKSLSQTNWFNIEWWWIMTIRIVWICLIIEPIWLEHVDCSWEYGILLNYSIYTKTMCIQHLTSTKPTFFFFVGRVIVQVLNPPPPRNPMKADGSTPAHVDELFPWRSTPLDVSAFSPTKRITSTKQSNIESCKKWIQMEQSWNSNGTNTVTPRLSDAPGVPTFKAFNAFPKEITVLDDLGHFKLRPDQWGLHLAETTQLQPLMFP